MRNFILPGVAAALTILLSGCNSSEPSSEGVIDETPPIRLQDPIDISLGDLLSKSRAELAQMAEECATRIQIQEKAHREGRLEFVLLPGLRLPLAIPIWRQAKYSNKLAFSVATYHPEESKDNALARHVAKFGDLEAARLLVDSKDIEVGKQIETAWNYERSYPLEWTRLTALLLHEAQIRLATGDIDGGKLLVGLHGQLRTILDPLAVKGPLGAALLPRGRRVLMQAAAAWRDAKKTDLANQADAVLADWGPTPGATGSLRPGLPRAEVSRMLRSPGEGRMVPALCTARALDLIEMPFPDEGAEAVLAWFDQKDHLSDIVICYKDGLAASFPEPVCLAHLLEEDGFAGKDKPQEAGLRRRCYQFGDALGEVTIVVHGAGTGGIVHISGEKAVREMQLCRNFAGFHLDRSFEQNRLGLIPEERGDRLVVSDPKALAGIRNLLPFLKPLAATIQREPGHDLAAALIVRYGVDEAHLPPFYRLLAPLGAEFGLPLFEGVADENGGHLAVRWEDARTRMVLSLPYESGRQVELEIRDRQGPERLAERQTTAGALDREERKLRLQSGNPRQGIGRKLEQLELGMNRAQVLKLLPSNKAALRREIPHGLMTTLVGDVNSGDVYTVRQLLARFDDSDHVVEIRIRYADGPGVQGEAKWMAEIFNRLKKRSGAPREESVPWASVWTDLPQQKPDQIIYRWQDDRTLLTYQADSGGVELVLRDWPLEHVNGVPLPPLDYLARGTAPFLLGARRDQLVKDLHLSDATLTEDGALVCPPPASSPYDAILIWFDKEKANRIVARHIAGESKKEGGEQGSGTLSAAWGREASALGWPCHQDMTPQGAVQGFGSHDERTRVRIFWQESEQGTVRIFTEWKDLESH